MLGKEKFLVVGAGFSGAVVARELVQSRSCMVDVIDARPHLAGNCHTARDPKSGVMLHHYGPHIFNTNQQIVWDYVNRFGVMRPFVNRIKAVHKGQVYSLPINLHTINQFFGKNLNPSQAKVFVESLGDQSIGEPKNFEEQALKFLGRDLYSAFFYGYTLKQWGCEPRELPASILRRLPVRFDYNDNYYNATYQGIPEQGYTGIIENLLDHPLISVSLNTPFQQSLRKGYQHVFYTGPLDEFFQYEFGRLGYRTVNFERIDAEGDYQGSAVINYSDPEVKFTRIHEHKHFTPWETHEKTVAFREFSKETEAADVPYYPKRLAADRLMWEKYRVLAEGGTGITFLGRLGTYRYMDMEAVIGEALEYSQRWFGGPASSYEWAVFPAIGGPA